MKIIYTEKCPSCGNNGLNIRQYRGVERCGKPLRYDEAGNRLKNPRVEDGCGWSRKRGAAEQLAWDLIQAKKNYDSEHMMLQFHDKHCDVFYYIDDRGIIPIFEERFKEHTQDKYACWRRAEVPDMPNAIEPLPKSVTDLDIIALHEKKVNAYKTRLKLIDERLHDIKIYDLAKDNDPDALAEWFLMTKADEYCIWEILPLQIAKLDK